VQPLRKEFEFYLEHQDEFVRKFKGKFVVIRGAEVLGGFDTEIEAIAAGAKHWTLGTFFVQRCEPGSENYTQVFHSRVATA
jgi:hypothetical protein